MKRKQKAAVIASVLAIAAMTTQVRAEQLTESMGNNVVSAETQVAAEDIAPAAQTGVLPTDTESSQDISDTKKETQKEEGTIGYAGQSEPITSAEKETEVLETGKEEQKTKQKEEQETKRWYAISFFDIAMQLLVAMLLIVLPGCWIYYKYKK